MSQQRLGRHARQPQRTSFAVLPQSRGRLHTLALDRGDTVKVALQRRSFVTRSTRAALGTPIIPAVRGSPRGTKEARIRSPRRWRRWLSRSAPRSGSRLRNFSTTPRGRIRLHKHHVPRRRRLRLSRAHPHPLKRRQLGVLGHLLGLWHSFHFRLALGLGSEDHWSRFGSGACGDSGA